MKLNIGKDAQLNYLRRQLDQAMRNNRKEVQSSCSFGGSKAPKKEAEEEASDSSLEERRTRRTGHAKQPNTDFKVEIP